jgi:SAM-dependent methyltransferase
MATSPEQEPAQDAVQAQYERWVYPPRVDDLATMPLTRHDWRHNDPRILWSLFWPDKEPREDLDMLIAGCGTLSAAIAAYLFPKSRVVGIDISRSSLEHEEFLKKKHNLQNLTLRHAKIEDVASLDVLPADRGFDHIVCHGVLHHTADSVRSLRCLGAVLRQDGVIDIMVYGKHGRIGVAMLQELFRILQVPQDEAGIDFVRQTLAALSPRHPVQTYRAMAAEDLAFDAGIVDTFLNVRDVPFSVSDCYKLVEDAGLAFQGWKEPGMYAPDLRLPPDHPLRVRLDRLPEREMCQAAELIDAAIPGHWFHVCRRDRDPATYGIRFEGDAFLDYIPISRVTQSDVVQAAEGPARRIRRPPFPPLVLTPRQTLLLNQVDGQRTVRQCIELANVSESPADAKEFARSFFQMLWRVGYSLYRIPAKT